MGLMMSGKVLKTDVMFAEASLWKLEAIATRHKMLVVWVQWKESNRVSVLAGNSE